jgi:hypothetical protein
MDKAIDNCMKVLETPGLSARHRLRAVQALIKLEEQFIKLNMPEQRGGDRRSAAFKAAHEAMKDMPPPRPSRRRPR